MTSSVMKPMPENVKKWYVRYKALGPGRNPHRLWKQIKDEPGRPTYRTLCAWNEKYQWDARITAELATAMTVEANLTNEVDTAVLNKETLFEIDRAIRSIRDKPEKTEKEVLSLTKLVELRAKIAQKIDDAEEKDRFKVVIEYVTKIRNQLEEEFRDKVNMAKAQEAS